MSYDPEPEPKRKPKRPLEDPAAIDLARKKTIDERADELRRALSIGPGGQKRQLARLFGKRVKAFKKLLRQKQARR
jgi:hypothetical protein